MKKFGLRFLSRTGKKPMICKKINKIKSSQKKYPQSKVERVKECPPSFKRRINGPNQVIH